MRYIACYFIYGFFLNKALVITHTIPSKRSIDLTVW